MKRIFTAIIILLATLGVHADTIVDAFIDFSTVTELPRFAWGGSDSAFERISLQNGCLHFESTSPTDPDWECQWFPIGGVDAEVGVTYTLHYKVKGDHNEYISAVGFGQTPFGEFPITTDWVEGTFDYECTETDGNILMLAGNYVGTFDIAYLMITHEGNPKPPLQWTELLVNGDAEKSWESLGLANVDCKDMDNNYKVCCWSKQKGTNVAADGGSAPFPAEIIQEPNGNHAFICRAALADTEGDASIWDNQIWIQSPRSWKAGEKVKLSFRYKASESALTNTEMHQQVPSEYLCWGIGYISFSTDWQTFEKIVTVSSDQDGMWSVAFDLNYNVKTPVDFYIDDLSWCEIEGTNSGETEIYPNETEVIIHGQERDWLPAKEDGTPQDGEEGIGEGQVWDNQFYIIGNRKLEVGERITLSFDYMAETPALISSYNTQGAGDYLHWAGVGDLNCTTEWQHFEKTITVPSETEGNQDSWTFCLAHMKGANVYHFKNIVFMTSDKSESLIDMEGTNNFYVKEGSGAAPHQFGVESKVETVDLDVVLNNAQYYGAPDYDWFYVFDSKDGLYQFRFDIPNQPEEGLPLDQEFTLADMLADYSWGKNLVTGAYINYASCTFKATEGASGIDYHATVVDLDGNTYNLKLETVAEEDVPKEVTNLVITDLSGKVGMTWDAPTEGVNGGSIIPENIRYNVYPVEIIESSGVQSPEIDFSNPYATGLKETKAEIDFDTNAGAQQYTYFGVTAQNVAGESGGVMGSLLTGAPYELPMHESFNGGLSYWWGVDYDDAIYDADGGLGITQEGELVFQAPVEGWIKLMSGKVALNGAENPALTFNYKAEANCSLQVQVVTPEGEEIIGMLPVEASEKYTTATIMLDAYADQPWVRFNLIGEFDGANNLFVDDINVLDMVAHDLSIALSAPKTLTAGKSAVVKATVLNMGQEVAKNYSVKFYVNDQELPAPLFETPALAFYESAEFETEIAASVFDEAGDITVKAEVVYAEDVKSENNADETLVTIVAPSATPVQSIAAEATTAGIVVNWTIADASAAEVTEDFENYEGNTVYAGGESCGPWLAADMAPGSAYYWNGDAVLWPKWQDPYAFGIMNFEMSALTGSFSAVSGDQCTLFMSNTTPADKYIISSELPGNAQTISFMAMPITDQYGAETFEVLASSTDTEVASFTNVASFSTAATEWTEFSANLPEGTKYFAIHYTSTDIFGLFVDDVKYTTGGSTPTGFNVYIDKALVATVSADTRTYTYAEEILEGIHEVSVTAVYGSTESEPVSTFVEVQKQIASYDVKYYVDGSLYHTEPVEEGTVIPSFDAPVKNGYTFVRWDGLPEDMIMPGHDVIATAEYQSNIDTQLMAEGNSGTCHWYITSEGKLVIEPTNGTEGTLDYWSAYTDVPWYSHHDEILSAEIKSGVTANTCSYFFMDCKNLQSVDLSGLNTQSVTDMRQMFYWCNSLTSLDLTNFNTANVTYTNNIFGGCNNLSNIISNNETPSILKEGTFSSFDKRLECTLSVPAGSALLYRAAEGWNELGLIGIDDSRFPEDVFAKGRTDSCIWYVTSDGCLVIVPEDGVSGDLSTNGWSLSSNIPWYSYRNNIISSRIEEGVNATSCSYMFSGLTYMNSIDLSNFNTANVTDMRQMFYWCKSLTSLDLSGFNTANVTNMREMFYGCNSLTSLDLSSFNTANVTDMSEMFYRCNSLTSLDLSSFDTANVTFMSHMFYGCSSLTSLDLSSFNTDKAGSMYNVFSGCSQLSTIISNNPMPSSLKVGTFSDSFENCMNCTLKVPLGTRELYAATDGWNELGWIDDGADVAFEAGNLSFKMESKELRTVIVVGVVDKTVDRIIVPEEVENCRVTFNVISMLDKAFADCPNLLEVVFEGAMTIPADAFEGSDTETNLFVYAPAGSKSEYNGNVVIDGVAENVVLKDAKPLRLSREFTTKKVSYSRGFTKKTYPGKAGGWETIVLPFEVQHIESEQGELTPFSDNTDGKHFWLANLRFNGFTNSSSIDPNTPYIISMPNSDEYDSAYNICGTVTFSAINARMYPTSNAQPKDGKDFRLVPTYEGVESSASVYTINDEDMHGYHAGAVFASASRDVRPFEAYAENLQNGAKPLYFEIEGTTNGIRDIHMEVNVPTTIYDLSGRPANASQKGFIIMRDSKGKHTKIYNK